ncbi:hypothetical protein TIFTF001_009002 [Ficus carica]|uniref:Uncharacterized protein n=1 Tax=Ficus carica TaxID=3494 RepID=A0AA88D3A6_FICCA|nr:hypothetical protein TIFTF001_009002 [Ficus carica]
MDNAKDRLLVIIAWFINDRVLRRREDEMWNLFTVEVELLLPLFDKYSSVVYGDLMSVFM